MVAGSRPHDATLCFFRFNYPLFSLSWSNKMDRDQDICFAFWPAQPDSSGFCRLVISINIRLHWAPNQLLHILTACVRRHLMLRTVQGCGEMDGLA